MARSRASQIEWATAKKVAESHYLDAVKLKYDDVCQNQLNDIITLACSRNFCIFNSLTATCSIFLAPLVCTKVKFYVYNENKKQV